MTRCKHCRREIDDASETDPNTPWIHSDTENAFCDVTGPEDAVRLAGALGRTEAEPADPGDRDMTFTGVLPDGVIIADGTNPWIEVDGQPVAWPRPDLPAAAGNDCEKCNDEPVPGVLTAMDSADGIQRCDDCERFEGDLEAAQAAAALVGGIVRFTPARNLKELADEIIEDLDKTYDLVYVDRGDKLMDDQVDAIVRGDLDALWESTVDWESENRYGSVKEIIEQAAKDITDRWSREDWEGARDYDELLTEFDGSEEWERVREAIEERDSGSWVKELIGNTPNPLLRISVLDEDHGFAFKDVQPEQVLAAVGLPVTDDNTSIMAATLAECSPEFSVLLGYWIIGADLSALYDLDADPERELEIVNPYLYLGNPFTGSGFISEKPFQGVVRVKRGDLRTDKGAFGYSVTEIYGGLSAGSFEAEIRPVTTEPVD